MTVYNRLRGCVILGTEIIQERTIGKTVPVEEGINMSHCTYHTQYVCAKQIHFDIQDDVITNIRFDGGCDGNLKALSKVLDGWTVDQIEKKLRGNLCGKKPTSCADQLAIAVRKAADRAKEEHRKPA